MQWTRVYLRGGGFWDVIDPPEDVLGALANTGAGWLQLTAGGRDESLWLRADDIVALDEPTEAWTPSSDEVAEALESVVGHGEEESGRGARLSARRTRLFRDCEARWRRG